MVWSISPVSPAQADMQTPQRANSVADRAVQSSSNQQGFTIVEILIVLAIAGLILSIVLFALPIFERNGRNNQRKQDVAAVFDAISRYELNNSASFPTTITALNSLHLSYSDPTTSGVTFANGGTTAWT